MDKEKHYCDNINCNYNDTKGLCCLFNPDNCKYRQLQKDYAELKKTYRKQRNKRIDELQKENAELEKEKAEDINTLNKCVEYWKNKSELLEEKLTKAKEIIKTLADDLSMYSGNYQKELLEAKQFLSDRKED